MSGDTAISWTEKVWNPVVGCTKVSQGCKFCYAFDVHDQRHQAYQAGKLQNIPQYAKPFSEVQLLRQRLMDPVRWSRPRLIFVNSMSDLFHPDVPDAYIDEVFGTMYVCAERPGPHTFQVLTKRPERMRDYLLDPQRRWKVAQAISGKFREGDYWFDQIAYSNGPLTSERIWLGTSVEDQRAADTRIPALLDTPAGLRFLSCEPLLGPVDLSGFGPGLGWVIAGGESGEQARPMHPDWARGLRDQCEGSSIPFHFKQWGRFDEQGQRAPTGRGWPQRLLDGREHNDVPQWGPLP